MANARKLRLDLADLGWAGLADNREDLEDPRQARALLRRMLDKMAQVLAVDEEFERLWSAAKTERN